MIYTLRAVDARKKDGFWVCDGFFFVADCVSLPDDRTSRGVLNTLRKLGYLRGRSFSVVFRDGGIEVRRADGCPVFHLEEHTI